MSGTMSSTMSGGPNGCVLSSHQPVMALWNLIAYMGFVAYKLQMATTRKLPDFDAWLRKLKDSRGKTKILSRIERLERGNPGDVGPVGDGISEMRIDFGPGYRVYYKQSGDDIVVLCAGDKDTQSRDIEKAKNLARELED
jgi:putative addiction module killer protein